MLEQGLRDLRSAGVSAVAPFSNAIADSVDLLERHELVGDLELPALDHRGDVASDATPVADDWRAVTKVPVALRLAERVIDDRVLIGDLSDLSLRRDLSCHG